MPLFQCKKCGCVENTALGHYWMPRGLGEPVLCSECGPEQKWHGHFLKRSASGMLIDQNGHLWSKRQVEEGQLPKGYTIQGEVP